MDSKDKKTKPYSSPTLTELTRDQAIKFVADRKHCSEEEASEFLKLLRQQSNWPGKDQDGKRPA